MSTSLSLIARPRAILVSLLAGLSLAGCGTAQRTPAPVQDGAARTASAARTPSGSTPALPPAGSGRGGYYQDDGPGDKVPDGLLATPDPEPKVEPYATRGNKPYTVFGKTYVPILDSRPFKQRGMGSWYGKKFHGQKTSSGEVYDMYKMTAAHPTLPIPSYARVTNLANGSQVIVRVNDRGPFHANRIIDLSYTAALKLGYLNQGSAQLEVERLLPEEIARMANNKAAREPATQPLAVPVSAAPAAAVPVAASPSSLSIPVVEAISRPVGAPLTAAAPTPAVSAGSAPVPSQTEPAVVVLPVAVPSMQTAPASAGAAPVAAPAPAVVAAPAAAPAGPVAAGVYLQLGAYSQAANAEAMRSQLLQNHGATLMPVEVVAGNGLYRLYSGPYASRAEATAAAQKLQDAGAAKPLIVQK